MPASDQLSTRAQLLKQRITIFEVLDALGIGVREAVTQQMKCPIHKDTTPSARLYAEENRVHCFTCGRSWDVIALVEARLGYPFGQALTFLEEIFGSESSAVTPALIRARLNARKSTDTQATYEQADLQIRRMKPQLTFDRYTRALVALDTVFAQHRTDAPAFLEGMLTVLKFAKGGITPSDRILVLPGLRQRYLCDADARAYRSGHWDEGVDSIAPLGRVRGAVRLVQGSLAGDRGPCRPGVWTAASTASAGVSARIPQFERDMQIFVDLDGVLADFAGGYAQRFGVRPDRNQPDPPDLWANIAQVDFFATLPLMPDALTLWEGLYRLHPQPVILTAVPRSVPHAADQKRAWVARHFGPDVPVTVCRAREKCLHGQPGDILIDDWDRYQRLWERMGGLFILHVTAETSLVQACLLAQPHA